MLDWGTIKDAKNIFKIYPIYDWETEDVWTAPKKLGWDYNRAYDVMDKAGLPLELQRCAPPFGQEPMQNLWIFSICFPELWDKMQNRVAGAATAARYSKTQIYSFGKKRVKPNDVEWIDWIKYYLEKWEEPFRTRLAKRIKQEIERHYRETTDPILETPHPETGLHWHFLLMIVDRGDFRHRKHVGAYIRPEEYEKSKKAYQKELESWRKK